MLGLDTNVLVRYLVRDDQAQYERARKLIYGALARGEPIIVSLLVLLETEWVLRSRYDLSKAEIVEVLSGFLDAADVQVQADAIVQVALFVWRDAAADFADCLIGAHYDALGCRAAASFDSKAARLPWFIEA